MTVADIIARLRARLGASVPEPAGQGLLVGDPQAPVDRVVVCQTPSVGILRAAAGQAGTLVIAREHPFYRHDEGIWSSRVDSELLAARDPVVVAKQVILIEGRIAVYRLSALWDAARPKIQGQALAEALGWRAGPSGGGRKVVCDIPPIALGRLAQQVRDRLQAGHVRVIGSGGALIRRVALLPEFVELGEAREIMTTTPAIDGLVCGETCEWEAAPYLKDTLDMHRAPIGVIFAGTQPTQEPGVRRMHDWIAGELRGLPVSYADAARPVRTLEARA